MFIFRAFTLAVTVGLLTPLVPGDRFNIPPAIAQVENTQDGDWQKFSSEVGNFSVMMPGTPEEDAESNQRGEMRQYLISLEDETIAYGVFYYDVGELPRELTPTEIDELFDASVAGFLEDWEEKNIRSENNIYLGDIPGRAIEVEGSEGMFKMRLYWAAPRLYMILVGSEQPEKFPTESDRFFDSFEFL